MVEENPFTNEYSLIRQLVKKPSVIQAPLAPQLWGEQDSKPLEIRNLGGLDNLNPLGPLLEQRNIFWLENQPYQNWGQ
ncbi:hypothetical protein N836_04655 [Leptolyngbya sp. Heron Island J]|nr:hypothetical protein N836_04655 [Leptolyngbya sp. Heron Island J]